MRYLPKLILGSMLLSGVWAAPALAADAAFTFTTLAGTPGAVINSAEGTGPDAQFSAPRGVAVDSAGNLYVADTNNNAIRKGSLASSSPNASADCAFNWAERNYSSLFPSAATSATSAPYYYRYYAATQTYIGVSSSDSHLYVYTGAHSTT